MKRSKLIRIRETLLAEMLNISPQIAEYISEHAADDPDRIRLSGKEIHGYPASFIADQIDARQRYRRRFPRLCTDLLTIFPGRLHLEQSSSEVTAALKADWMNQQTGNVKRIIDLTAGFGVDAFAMSKMTEKIILVEPDDNLRAITESNFNRMIPGKAEFSPLHAEEFLSTFTEKSDWIYLDPSRRKSGSKVYRLEDSAPNPIVLINELLRIADHILIKTSPMLDITTVMRQWNQIKNIIIISVANECREVLYHFTAEKVSDPELTCINVKNESKEICSFRRSEEGSIDVRFADPMKFIYEPNTSVLKAGAFKWIAQKFNLCKLAPHTHLYTAENLVPEFPGRIFQVIRSIEKTDQGIKANIISRNHPMTTDDISFKFKVKDGGDDFIIACSGVNRKFLLFTRRISDSQ